MSTRYGIGVSLEPVFTARAYRARQLICGQYACWAAEMNMLFLPLSNFFQCPGPTAPFLDEGLSSIAARSREQAPQFSLDYSGVEASPGGAGHIFLALSPSGGQPYLGSLRDSVSGLLAATGEVVLGPGEESHPGIPIMQYAKLPASVFHDAVEFAKAVVADLGLAPSARVWRLLLFRYQSEVAGDDWSEGSWAPDLSWELLASHPL